MSNINFVTEKQIEEAREQGEEISTNTVKEPHRPLGAILEENRLKKEAEMQEKFKNSKIQWNVL